MNAGNPQDLVQATMQVVAAYISNPNTKVSAADVPELMSQFHRVALGLAASTPSIAAAPGVARLDDAFSAPRLAAPQGQAGLPTRTMTPEARTSLEGSLAFLGGGMPQAGEHFESRIWKGVPLESRKKFQRLIDEHNIQIGPDGYPIPRRPVDRLISQDRMQVADPITGEYHTMLKRHLKVAHDLDHEELLAMFNLTESQLPRSGPKYSEAKALQAKRTGLGKNKKPAVAAQVGKTKARRRERAVA